MTGLCLFDPPVRELVLAVLTGITGTYGVHMITGRTGIPNGVSGPAAVGLVGGIRLRLFETRASLLAVPGLAR